MMPYGWHDGAWGVLWMIGSWALLIGLVVWIVRWSDRGSTREPPARTGDRTDPERILEERFARGEISEQELAERRRVLRSVARPDETPDGKDVR